MNSNNLSLLECQILWVVGVTERLVMLGIMKPDLPLNLVPEAQEAFMILDENVNSIFADDSEIVELFKVMVKTECNDLVSEEDTNTIASVILQYKNNRTELVKYALKNSMKTI